MGVTPGRLGTKQKQRRLSEHSDGKTAREEGDGPVLPAQPGIWETDHLSSHGRWQQQDPQETGDKSVSLEPEGKRLFLSFAQSVSLDPCPGAVPKCSTRGGLGSKNKSLGLRQSPRVTQPGLFGGGICLRPVQIWNLNNTSTSTLASFCLFPFLRPSLHLCLFLSLPPSLCSSLRPDSPIHPPVVVDRAPHSNVTSFWLCQFHLQ